ncbi:hypothetical protein [Nocardioides sp.]|uniref:hypothetical protein n=1 Tax=Nocardioides sp. TaxID=35761 RepID=UPI0037843102
MREFVHNDAAEEDLWIPPETFRDGLADAERVASLLVATLADEGALLIPVERVQFLARRLYRLTADAHAALPPNVG